VTATITAGTTAAYIHHNNNVNNNNNNTSTIYIVLPSTAEHMRVHLGHPEVKVNVNSVCLISIAPFILSAAAVVFRTVYVAGDWFLLSNCDTNSQYNTLISIFNFN